MHVLIKLGTKQNLSRF
uniref:Uncharacterized protein n=1 Tax=Arundo donax TaxID=35708 RepID=A0A0A8YL55_ARUDO